MYARDGRSGHGWCDAQAADRQLFGGELAQICQQPAIAFAEIIPWPRIDNAQRAECMPGGRAERHPGIKTEMSVARDKRIVVEPIIQRGIGDHQHIVAGDGMRTKGDVASHVACANPDGRSEKGFVFADHVGRRCGRLEKPGRQFDDRIELRFKRIGDETIIRQLFEALRFIRQDFWTYHDSSWGVVKNTCLQRPRYRICATEARIF